MPAGRVAFRWWAAPRTARGIRELQRAVHRLWGVAEATGESKSHFKETTARRLPHRDRGHILAINTAGARGSERGEP